MVAIAFAGLTSFADSGTETAKPGGASGAHGGTGTDPAHAEPASPPARDGTDTNRKSPPTVDGTKPEGHGAAGPDVSTGQGGTTGAAPAPGTGTSK
jgi:hypothetical protein